MKTKVKIYGHPKKVAKKVAKAIKKQILESANERFDIALSGGNTPRILFKYLAERYATVIPWRKVHFWWGDERCVPPDNVESNFRMANESLFLNITVPADNIHRIHGENNPEQEANRYSAELLKHLTTQNDIPVFDIILLGMGDDGHTASIFPDRLDLLQTDQLSAVAKHPSGSQKRITLTGKVINNARTIFFMVTGENKANRIAEIMKNEKVAKLHPAYYVAPGDGQVYWFLDEAAASQIESSD